MKTKNIVFVFPEGCSPVPAVDGGAVESLINVLIDQNELHNKFKFHIVMCKHKKDTRKYDYSKYNNTYFYDFYQSDYKFKIDKIVNAVNKRLTYALPLYSSYDNFIIKTIERIKPNFVIYEGSFNAAIKKLVKLLGKEKLIYHVHHQVLPKIHVDKFFGHMLCVSDFIRRDWQAYGLNNNFQYHILNNCITSETFKKEIDQEEIEKMRSKLGISPKDFVIIYCGRLIVEKGVDHLIKAVNALNQPDIKLLIVGNSAFNNSSMSPYVKYLKTLVDKNQNNIIFTGFVPNYKLPLYYSIANLQVIPSVWEEAAGIVALEGSIIGVKQIVTNSGGLLEYAGEDSIVIDKNGDICEQLKVSIQEVKAINSQKKLGVKKVWDSEFYYNLFDKIISKIL